MAKTRSVKTKILEDYKQKLADSKGIIVFKPRKLSANETVAIKKELWGVDADMHVVKNTLFKIALKESDLTEVESLAFGEHAVVFMSEDIATPAKSLKKFAKELKLDDKSSKITFVAGFIDSEYLDETQVTELAEMPTKEGSIALILGILDQAMGGVVNVLEDAPRSYVTIIDQAFKDK